ncbi:hypothetical protein F4775DRAFT_96695 [Biscogniauxia sp. FL1348]|nr:hypothetical protein F4775DRAFT_96695 [Biscogniauxia sp. FL1348]
MRNGDTWLGLGTYFFSLFLLVKRATPGFSTATFIFHLLLGGLCSSTPFFLWSLPFRHRIFSGCPSLDSPLGIGM